MFTSNIDIMLVCLTFFCKYISQEFNSASRSSRVLCLFYLFVFIFFFLILMFVYVPATFTVALCWLFFFFLFFYFYYCNNVFCVTTSHRYLHWATHMKGSVNSDNEKSRFISGGICRQHCLSHVSFMAAFAYIKCRICVCECECVSVCVCVCGCIFEIY